MRVAANRDNLATGKDAVCVKVKDIAVIRDTALRYRGLAVVFKTALQIINLEKPIVGRHETSRSYLLEYRRIVDFGRTGRDQSWIHEAASPCNPDKVLPVTRAAETCPQHGLVLFDVLFQTLASVNIGELHLAAGLQ